MKFLCQYFNSENGLCKLFADTATLERKMLVMSMWHLCLIVLFVCLLICCLLTAAILLANKVAYKANYFCLLLNLHGPCALGNRPSHPPPRYPTGRDAPGDATAAVVIKTARSEKQHRRQCTGLNTIMRRLSNDLICYVRATAARLDS